MQYIKLKRIVFILLTAFTAACSSKPDKQPVADSAKVEKQTDPTVITLTAAQIKSAGIETGPAEMKNMHALIKVNGTVDVPPENVHTVSFPMSGYVKSNKLIPGMQVQKGMLLAVLEDQAFIQMQQDYLAAKARLEFNEADYNRQVELNKSQSNSQRVLQQSKADFETQKVMVRSLGEKLRLVGIKPEHLKESNLSRSVAIYAPLTGYVSKVNINPGKYISPADVLFELIDPSEVHIDLQVFENDAQYLKKGQTVLCSSNANPDKKYSAVLELITHNLDENKAIEVHCHLVNPTRDLLPGSFINAEIAVSNQQAAAVPDDALVTWQGKHYVFVATNNSTFSMKEVEPGNAVDGFTAIGTKLPGTSIVTKNAYTLLTMLKNKGEE
ncbi:efflux RND transporter periplasmic adaptor subunit [Mucilaginibacter gynuensis]|uniref:Efflux RND transporter periplasmic adaptor subunit n=1 Tax=Mucilaginibacter gynuensis TaxID=1302236 RepID=A0ABP8G4H7_9SPHI